MDIIELQTNFKFLIINMNTNTSHVLKTDRQVSDLLKKIYDITVSHMYVRRNLNDNLDFIVKDDILIKKVW